MQNKTLSKAFNHRQANTFRKIATVLVLLIIGQVTVMGQSKFSIKGMYLQWGYNTEWFTRSDIHFKGAVNGVPHDFTAYGVKATDRNDMDAIFKKPIQISVPQYNYRIGFYLNAAKTKAIELNFDHTKYIAKDNQRLHLKGMIGDKYIDQDTLVTSDKLFAFEHTNGANFYHINYVQFWPLNKTNRKAGYFVPMLKVGAGFMIPKTDVTLFGKRLDNKFHLAGYMASVEGGIKYYITRNFFFEATAKTGYAKYTNALTVDGGKAKHAFGYAEVIGTFGYDINW